jgi:hypothetical protein
VRKIIDKITGSDYFLFAVLFILGIFNFGWIFFPTVGEWWSAINGAIFLGIVVVAVLYRFVAKRDVDETNSFSIERESHEA